MLKHFFKVAFRNIMRKGKMSLLNILGLSLGIASSLVISLYVFQERSFEKGFADHDRIFRVEEHFLSMGHVAWTTANLQFSLEEIPEIEAFARVRNQGTETILLEGQGMKPGRTLVSDNRFFELFDYPILLGNSDAPLTGPGSAVISEELANRLFGRSDVVGESLELKALGKVAISAVVATPVTKSHLDFNLLVNFDKPEKLGNSWYGIGGYTFVRTTPGTTSEQLKVRLDKLTEEKVFPKAFKPSPDMTFEQWMAHENRIEFLPRPIEDIYLQSNLQFELGSGGDAQMLTTLSLIAVFILVIAAINFMNLTTARSSGRTREIGMRKVLGTRKGGLVGQFLFESMLVTLVAATLGAGLSEALIYAINDYFGQVIGISLFSYPGLIPVLLLGVLLLGLLAGIYPAFYLSSAKVIPLLKGMKLSYVLNLNIARVLRNGLVVTQFTLSTGMIIATLFIYQQLIYLQEKDLGFSEEQVLVITNTKDLDTNTPAFKDQVLSIPGVSAASYAGRLPGDESQSVQSIMLDANNAIAFQSFSADLDFLQTLDIELRAGEWFRRETDNAADSITNVVVNQAAVQALGLKEPVGEIVGNAIRIIGVVEDFNFASLKEEVGPVLIGFHEKSPKNMALKVSAGQIPYQQIESAWRQFTNMPMETKMLEQNFDELLYKEEQSANTVLFFTILAIIISCLGLFGLAAFTADQRLHEFGIRKVLGASVMDIVKLFGLDFLKLIGIAFLVSVPLSIWGVNQWLQGYADRISMTAGVFLLAGVLAIFIALGTILFQSIKTGRLNPVETIRSE